MGSKQGKMESDGKNYWMCQFRITHIYIVRSTGKHFSYTGDDAAFLEATWGLLSFLHGALIFVQPPGNPRDALRLVLLWNAVLLFKLSDLGVHEYLTLQQS